LSRLITDSDLHQRASLSQTAGEILGIALCDRDSHATARKQDGNCQQSK
jgi:hypothetical protein